MTGNAWIITGIIAAAIAAFAIPYGFHLKSEQQSQPSVQIAGDYVAGPKVADGGDYIAGDKTINIGPSKEEMEEIVRRVIKESTPKLSKTFGDAYTVFGISESGIVIPKGKVPSGLDVNWKTGRVIKVTDKMVEVMLPDIVANTKHIRNFRFSGNTVSLSKEAGTRMNLIKTKDFVVQVEVIGVDRRVVVVGLGLAPSD